MEVDEALGKLGFIGRWQILNYVMIGIVCSFPSVFHMLAIIYIGAWPEHHCNIPDGTLINETIPLKEDGSYDSCHVYTDEDKNETTKCNEWKYIDGDIGPTIVSKWDLVCDRAYLKDLTQTIFGVGMMVGSVTCTPLSDNFGRKPIFLLSQWAMVVVGVATAFAPNYYVFAFCRFITGVFEQGILLPGSVMIYELFAAKYRTFAGTVSNFWAVGMCLLALLAYLVQNWVHLQLIISLFGLLSIPLYWLLPESVVWLCAKNRVAEAEQIIRNAAKLNNIAMPDKILARSDTSESPADDIADDGDKKKGGKWKLLEKFRSRGNWKKSKKTEDGSARYMLLDIFRNRHLTVNMFCTVLLWIVVALVYYGLSLSAGQLAGNLYVNSFISGIVEIPAYTSALFAAQRFGRRKSLLAHYAVSGIALILSQVIPEHAGNNVSLVTLRITCSMLAKCAISGVFAILVLYTPEIFPTTIRSQAMGVASFAGRIGGMIAPFTSLMAKELPWLPGLLFGGLSTAAGLISLLLPETLGRPLPQTIDDIEQWYSGKQPAGAKSADSVDQQEMSPMNRDHLNNDTVA